MKQMLLTICLSFGVTLCFSQINCSSFQTGKFMYKDSAGNIFTVVRTKKKQMETSQKTNLVTKSKIKWISDCAYQLKQIWANQKSRRKFNGAVTTINITRTNGNDSYEYSCACKGLPSKENAGTMVRVSY